jgi:hypothetical protein
LQVESDFAVLFLATTQPDLPTLNKIDKKFLILRKLESKTKGEVNPAIIEKESEKVFWRTNNRYVTRLDIQHLREYVSKYSLDRARICLHHSDEAHLQEMLMVFDKSNFVPPAYHPYKDESKFG